jgi:hypothetical protein
MKRFANIHKNKTYNFIIRSLIVLATYYFIYKQIFQNRKLDYVTDSFSELIHQPHVTLLFVWTLLLMIVNWGIESLKWQFLIGKVEKVPYLKAFEAILSGISVSIFTPNRIGEWFGRVFILKKANPWKGVFITMIGSFSQLLITIIIGAVSLLFYIHIYFQNAPFYSNYILAGMILIVSVVIISLVLLFLNITSVPGFISRILKKKFIHLNDYVSVISSYSSVELFTVLLFSFLRYCIFALQFYILLMLFSVKMPIAHGLMIISVVFFVMTAIPTVTLAELGVRGSISLYFIGEYFRSFGEVSDKINIGIVSSTSTLWLINLALPAVLGTLFVYRLTFFRKRKA